MLVDYVLFSIDPDCLHSTNVAREKLAYSDDVGTIKNLPSLLHSKYSR